MSRRLLHLVRPGRTPHAVADADRVVYTQSDPDVPFTVETDHGRRPVTAAELHGWLRELDGCIVW